MINNATRFLTLFRNTKFKKLKQITAMGARRASKSTLIRWKKSAMTSTRLIRHSKLLCRMMEAQDSILTMAMQGLDYLSTLQWLSLKHSMTAAISRTPLMMKKMLWSIKDFKLSPRPWRSRICALTTIWPAIIKVWTTFLSAFTMKNCAKLKTHLISRAITIIKLVRRMTLMTLI